MQKEDFFFKMIKAAFGGRAKEAFDGYILNKNLKILLKNSKWKEKTRAIITCSASAGTGTWDGQRVQASTGGPRLHTNQHR